MIRPLLLILILLFSCECALAGKLYKYLDEDGVLVFTDKPMPEKALVEVEQTPFVESKTYFHVENQGTQARPVLYGVNDYYAPVEVEVLLNESRNMASSTSLPRTFVVEPRSRQKLVELWPVQTNQGYAYSYQTQFVLGRPGGSHSPSDAYLPPAPLDRGFVISQSFHGESTHKYPQNEFAVDIPMPVGTPVLAARSGVVMEVFSGFFENGRSERMKSRANSVTVLHDDGTMAQYAHLKQESARVSVGTRVSRGQVLAESGNTGYSSGPHLHFVILQNVGMERRSIPFAFLGGNGRPFTPQRGMLLSGEPGRYRVKQSAADRPVSNPPESLRLLLEDTAEKIRSRFGLDSN